MRGKTDPLEPRTQTLDDLSRGDESAQIENAGKTRTTIWTLSLAGFLPFAVFSLALLWLDTGHMMGGILRDGLKTYGAVILSFLGGMRWGLALKMAEPQGRRLEFVLSVVPSLIGWAAVFMPEPASFAVLAAAFAGQGAWDSIAGHRGVFGLWFVKLRTVMTFLVTASLVVALFASA